MVGCCLLLSTALFVVAHRPVIVDDCVAANLVAIVSPVASTFVTLQSRRSRPHCCRRCGQRRGPVGGHEAMVEDQLVLQR